MLHVVPKAESSAEVYVVCITSSITGSRLLRKITFFCTTWEVLVGLKHGPWWELPWWNSMENKSYVHVSRTVRATVICRQPWQCLEDSYKLLCDSRIKQLSWEWKELFCRIILPWLLTIHLHSCLRLRGFHDPWSWGPSLAYSKLDSDHSTATAIG